jgi:rubrerythrin
MSLKIDFKTLTLMDALDLAIFIEKEARERYEAFSENVGTRYKGDAGDFFADMARNEGKHEAELMKRRAQLFKTTPVRVNPEVIWDVEAPEQGAPRAYMSPRQAMELALLSEVKAYTFFDQALAHVRDPQVKELFTELRGEEVEHQNMLKAAMAKLPKSDTEHLPDRDEDDLDDPSQL